MITPPKQQAQDAVPHERLHVNGAVEDGPVSGGGNKSPPGNGKAPPPGNGAEGRRSLRERVAALETEHKHLATKADLEKGLRVTEARLSKQIQSVQEAMWKQPIVILTGVAILMAISANWDKFFS